MFLGNSNAHAYFLNTFIKLEQGSDTYALLESTESVLQYYRNNSSCPCQATNRKSLNTRGEPERERDRCPAGAGLSASDGAAAEAGRGLLGLFSLGDRSGASGQGVWWWWRSRRRGAAGVVVRARVEGGGRRLLPPCPWPIAPALPVAPTNPTGWAPAPSSPHLLPLITSQAVTHTVDMMRWK